MITTRFFFTAGAALLMLSGCCKHEARTLKGSYEGTFDRIDTTGDYTPVDVTLDFADGTFSGTSDQEKYPAIGNGSFVMHGKDSVTFTNSNVWTADFDWTLILDGTYRIKWRGAGVTLTQQISEARSNVYYLDEE